MFSAAVIGAVEARYSDDDKVRIKIVRSILKQKTINVLLVMKNTIVEWFLHYEFPADEQDVQTRTTPRETIRLPRRQAKDSE